MRHLLTCLALALLGPTAWAQASQVAISVGTGFAGCPTLIVNNLGNHNLDVQVQVTVTSSSSSFPNDPPTSRTWANRVGLVRARDYVEASAVGNLIDVDCKKPVGVRWVVTNVTDLTANEEAEGDRFQQAVRDADRNLQNQRDQARAIEQAKQAEREARLAREQANREAAEASMRASQEVQRAGQDAQRAYEQSLIRQGSPQCRVSFSFVEFQRCEERVRLETAKARGDELARLKQQQQELEARRLGEQREAERKAAFDTMDPETCAPVAYTPSWDAADSYKKTIPLMMDQAVIHCQQARAGRNAALQKQEAARIVAEQEAVRLQQAREEEARRAEIRAQLQQQAQQSMANMNAAFADMNTNLRSQSSSLQNDNAALERYINSIDSSKGPVPPPPPPKCTPTSSSFGALLGAVAKPC